MSSLFLPEPSLPCTRRPHKVTGKRSLERPPFLPPLPTSQHLDINPFFFLSITSYYSFPDTSFTASRCSGSSLLCEYLHFLTSARARIKKTGKKVSRRYLWPEPESMAPAKAMAPFAKDERVLCFHHEMLYEAKVLDSRATDSGSWQYKIHYKGWKNT